MAERIRDIASRWLMTKTTARRPDGTTRLTPTTIGRYCTAVNNHIIPDLGNIWVEHLTKKDIQRWRDKHAERYRSKTINGWHRILRDILKSESETECTAAALVQSLTEDDSRTTDDAPNLLTAPELMKVLEVFRDVFPGHYALVLVLATTTMRISTALAINWEDVDPVRGVFHARKRRSGKLIVPGVKRSRVAKDTPPLLPHVLEVLNEHRKSLNVAQRQSGLVFPNLHGGYRARSVLDQPMKRALALAGIDKRVTPSTGLRRTGVVLYRQAADAAVAQCVAGHTTLSMHLHYGPAQDQEKQNAAEGAFGNILGGKK